MRTGAILYQLLLVTNVIPCDLPVVIDNGSGFLGTLPDSINVTAAAWWGSEHGEVGAIWRWDAAHASAELRITLRGRGNRYRTKAAPRTQAGRGLGRNWAAIWGDPAAAIICCSRKPVPVVIRSRKSKSTADVTATHSRWIKARGTDWQHSARSNTAAALGCNWGVTRGATKTER
jgi:hypothetical protein